MNSASVVGAHQPVGPTRSRPALARTGTPSFERLGILLVISGVFGLVGGIATAEWQVAVEPAQALVGLVQYGPGDLAPHYFATVFSLTIHLASLFLLLVRSEYVASIALCAIFGVIAAQTVAMLFYFALRRLHAALALTLLVCTAEVWKPTCFIFGQGISYPIWLFGTEHTFGRVGLIFVVYAVLFLAVGRLKTGLFLCGMAVWVHPAWGAWFNMCLFLAVVSDLRGHRELFTSRNVGAYAAGIAASLVALYLHRNAFAVGTVHPVPDPEYTRQLFEGYVAYWDFHRAKFDGVVLLSNRFFLVSLTAILAALHLWLDRSLSPGERIFLKTALISAVLSSVFVFVPSWFDPSLFPQWAITVMPGRFVTFSSFLVIPLLIFGCCTLFRITSGERLKYHFVLAPASLFLFLAVRPWFDWITSVRALTFLTTVAVLMFVFVNLYPYWGSIPLLKAVLNRSFVRRSVAVIVPLCLAAVVLFGIRTQGERFKPSAIVADLAGQSGPGKVLTVFEFWLVQVHARKPLISPHVNGYIYAGTQALVLVDTLMNDIYGIALSKPPAAAINLHSTIIRTSTYRGVWERRDCGEWSRLAKTYDFSAILVSPEISLRAKLVSERPDGKIYHPECG